LQLFYVGKSEENFSHPYCSYFKEHSCVKSALGDSYGDAICPGEQEFHNRNFQPSFSSFCPQNVIGNTAGNYVLGAEMFMGKKCFQIKVCCEDFQPHIEGQQNLSWEQICFSRSQFAPHF